MALITEANRKWWTLAAVTFPLFMVMLDTTIVNVALPAIQQDLQIGLAKLEWTVNGFLIVYAVLLLTGGKLADFRGRRRIFLLGFLVFTISSLFCGLAWNGEVLIAARAAQGAGAALMLPASQSILTATFEPRERGTAFGIWVAVSGVGLALGPLVGGLIIEGIDWRWIFYVNVPVGIIALIGGGLIIRESRDTSEDQRLDVPGLIVSAVALFALTFGLIEGNRFGWGSAEIVISFVVAAIGIVAFIVLEARQRAPMLDLTLFRNSTFSGAIVTNLLVSLALLGVLFFVSIYLQVVLGYSAIEAGAIFLPMTGLFILVSPLAGKLSDRVGPRWPITVGMFCLGVSLLLFAQLDGESSFGDMLAPLLVGGLGMGLTLPPTNEAGLGSVPVDKTGVAAGVLNTFRQMGGVLGIAIMGAILASQLHGLTPRDRGFGSAFVGGFQDALFAAAVISFAGAVTAALTIRRHRHLEAHELTAAGH